jgi:hypothetical protein
MHTKLWSGNLNGRDHLDDLGIDRRVLIKCILKKEGLYQIQLSQNGPVAGSCEHCNGPLGSIKGWEFLE